MVWPADRTFVRPDGESIKVPRARFYVTGAQTLNYFILINSLKNNAIDIAGLGDYLYKKYKNIDIFFLTKKKVKVCTSNIEVANLIALDSDLNTNFSVYIPSEVCEVKGVVPIASSYSEEEIYKEAIPKNLLKFGEVAEFCRIAEVKRFLRKDNNNLISTDSVLLCFSGDRLPSHVTIGGVHYPVNPYRENVLQCKKCFHYNHTEKRCTRANAICGKCGDVHEYKENCNNPTKCVNCGGEHSSMSKVCPIYKKLLNAKIQKANLLKPKAISIFEPTYARPALNQNIPNFNNFEFPPLGSRKQSMSKSPLDNNIQNKQNESNKSITAKRPRKEVDQAAISLVDKVNKKRVCDDLEKVVKSQIAIANPNTILVIKPFFESVANAVNSKETTSSEDILKPAFAAIVNFLNSFNNNDENITAELH